MGNSLPYQVPTTKLLYDDQSAGYLPKKMKISLILTSLRSISPSWTLGAPRLMYELLSLSSSLSWSMGCRGVDRSISSSIFKILRVLLPDIKKWKFEQNWGSIYFILFFSFFFQQLNWTGPWNKIKRGARPTFNNNIRVHVRLRVSIIASWTSKSKQKQATTSIGWDQIPHKRNISLIYPSCSNFAFYYINFRLGPKNIYIRRQEKKMTLS